MIKTAPFFRLTSFLVVLFGLVSACAPSPQASVQTLVALSVADGATPTPGLSAVSLPTEAPTMTGPLATLTAIAPYAASPVADTTPYTIEVDGQPHFLEFYAWW